jgi:ABC-2 type transport system ATP-binding protein
MGPGRRRGGSVDVVLRCHGLRRTYGDLVAVEDVGFEVRAGETYGLLGPNGAGKTTTISMLAGLLRPDAGEIDVVGRRMHPGAMDAKALVGLVPQELAIYPDLTARENLTFFGHLHGISRADLGPRIGEVLAVIGLEDRADDRSDTFSGGMKRRLNIGIGLLHRPTLLVLDEPTVGVDPQSRNAILTSVEELATAGMAVLYTTHYMEEAERLCDRIAIVDQGRIVGEGTRRELVTSLGEQDLVRLGVHGELGEAAAACATLPAVASADADPGESPSEGSVVCLLTDAAGSLPALLSAVSGTGATVTSVEVRQPDLEDVFLHLTGRALRD